MLDANRFNTHLLIRLRFDIEEHRQADIVCLLKEARPLGFPGPDLRRCHIEHGFAPLFCKARKLHVKPRIINRYNAKAFPRFCGIAQDFKNILQRKIFRHHIAHSRNRKLIVIPQRLKPFLLHQRPTDTNDFKALLYSNSHHLGANHVAGILPHTEEDIRRIFFVSVLHDSIPKPSERLNPF